MGKKLTPKDVEKILASKNPYEILGLSKDVVNKDIREAYKDIKKAYKARRTFVRNMREVRKLHPEFQTEEAKAYIKEVREKIRSARDDLLERIVEKRFNQLLKDNFTGEESKSIKSKIENVIASSDKEYYNILGLSKGASEEDVEAAYKDIESSAFHLVADSLSYEGTLERKVREYAWGIGRKARNAKKALLGRFMEKKSTQLLKENFDVFEKAKFEESHLAVDKVFRFTIKDSRKVDKARLILGDMFPDKVSKYNRNTKTFTIYDPFPGLPNKVDGLQARIEKYLQERPKEKKTLQKVPTPQEVVVPKPIAQARVRKKIKPLTPMELKELHHLLSEKIPLDKDKKLTVTDDGVVQIKLRDDVDEEEVQNSKKILRYRMLYDYVNEEPTYAGIKYDANTKTLSVMDTSLRDIFDSIRARHPEVPGSGTGYERYELDNFPEEYDFPTSKEFKKQTRNLFKKRPKILNEIGRQLDMINDLGRTHTGIYENARELQKIIKDALADRSIRLRHDKALFNLQKKVGFLTDACKRESVLDTSTNKDLVL